MSFLKFLIHLIPTFYFDFHTLQWASADFSSVLSVVKHSVFAIKSAIRAHLKCWSGWLVCAKTRLGHSHISSHILLAWALMKAAVQPHELRFSILTECVHAPADRKSNSGCSQFLAQHWDASSPRLRQPPFLSLEKNSTRPTSSEREAEVASLSNTNTSCKGAKERTSVSL